MRLWETTPSVAPLTFHQRLAEMAASLMGEARLLLWQDQALYKEPGGRVTTAHQDQPFWPIGDAPLISAWIPLVDVTAELGAMAYVPGSHKAGRLRPVDITHSTEPYDILSDPALGGAEPQTVTAPAGSVIWHDGYTVHEANPNRSNDIRKAFTIVYLAAGYRRAKDWPVFPLDRAGVKIGELMEGPGMPQVWPPPEDGIPTPDWTIGRGTGAQI